MAVGWFNVGKGELQSHDEREQVLGLHKNRSIREFHLHRILSNGKERKEVLWSLNVCCHLTPLLTALSASQGKEEAAFVCIVYLQNLVYFRSHLLQGAWSIDFFETDALMEISIYMLVFKMSSFNQLLLSERLCCISSLETLRHQGAQVQPLASIVQYNL